MRKRKYALTKDKWGRPEVYLAQYTDEIGAGNTCVFTNKDAAIFFVISGLSFGAVDWSQFPDLTKKYPYEDRTGNEAGLTPLFRIEQKVENGRTIRGTVMKMAADCSWSVGNGIALAARRDFLAATGRDVVVLSGEGSSLSASAGE